jgi:large-conductance mechanosensitive channel
MDSTKLVVIIAVAFTSIVTALNWSKIEPLQRILYPL